MQVNQNQFVQKLPNHFFRTEIPNCVDEIGLDPYEYRVYAHIKKITGDTGQCWKSIPHMAEDLQMGETKLRDCLNNLIDGKNKYKLKLLEKIKRKKADGRDDTCIYNVIDIWEFNGKFYRGGGSPKKPHQGSPGKPMGSPGEDKEEPLEEEPILSKHTTTTNTIQCNDYQTHNGGGGLKEIFFKNQKGEVQKIREELIFKYFIQQKLPYDTVIVRKCIEELEKSDDFISNIFKYLEAICFRLSRKKEEKKEIKSKGHCYDKNVPFVSETITWEEAEKRYEEKKLKENV